MSKNILPTAKTTTNNIHKLPTRLVLTGDGDKSVLRLAGDGTGLAGAVAVDAIHFHNRAGHLGTAKDTDYPRGETNGMICVVSTKD